MPQDKSFRIHRVIALAFEWLHLECFAFIAKEQEQGEQAVKLMSAAEAVREKLGAHRPPIEGISVGRDLEVIHSKLNESELARLWAEGQSMTVDQAVAFALQE